MRNSIQIRQGLIIVNRMQSTIKLTIGAHIEPVGKATVVIPAVFTSRQSVNRQQSVHRATVKYLFLARYVRAF